MSIYSRPCRLKKEARPFFKEELATKILSYDNWKEYYHISEDALEEVQDAYITYGCKRYSEYANTCDLSGWANPDNDENKKNGTAGAKFAFTIHFPSCKYEEYDKFSKGRMTAGLMDRIQRVVDSFYRDFVSGELDEFGNNKNGEP